MDQLLHHDALDAARREAVEVVRCSLASKDFMLTRIASIANEPPHERTIRPALRRKCERQDARRPSPSGRMVVAVTRVSEQKGEPASFVQDRVGPILIQSIGVAQVLRSRAVYGCCKSSARQE